MSETTSQSKKLTVTFNYNGNMVKEFNIPPKMSEKQIDAWIKKKYGIYDVKNWVVT